MQLQCNDLENTYLQGRCIFAHIFSHIWYYGLFLDGCSDTHQTSWPISDKSRRRVNHVEQYPQSVSYTGHPPSVPSTSALFEQKIWKHRRHFAVMKELGMSRLPIFITKTSYGVFWRIRSQDDEFSKRHWDQLQFLSTKTKCRSL